MKSTSPEYLNLPVPAAPRKYWELLFPLPYKADVVRAARQRDLDPFPVGGLDPPGIRVRSAGAFAVQGVRADADSPRHWTAVCTQGGGIEGGPRACSNQPAANLKSAASFLRSMLDQQGGSVEQTLAAYNAGPRKVVEWMAWGRYLGARRVCRVHPLPRRRGTTCRPCCETPKCTGACIRRMETAQRAAGIGVTHVDA